MTIRVATFAVEIPIPFYGIYDSGWMSQKCGILFFG